MTHPYNKYLISEKELAGLLDCTPLHQRPKYPLSYIDKEGREIYSTFTSSNIKILELITEFSIELKWLEDHIRVWYTRGKVQPMTFENYNDHPSKIKALRYAVVLAVIDKLKKGDRHV